MDHSAALRLFTLCFIGLAACLLTARMGRPEEIATVVAFRVYDAASCLAGQIIHVNGGGPEG